MPSDRRATQPSIRLSLAAGIVLASSGAATAQTNSPLIRPVIPPGYDQGRNVGVLERERPDYDPLGIRSGGLLILPRLDIGVAASNNVYALPDRGPNDAYVSVAPSVNLNTDWSRHEAQLSGEGRFRRYVSQPRLNRDEWAVRSSGRLDVDADHRGFAEVQVARVREDPFGSQIDAPLAILSTYRRIDAALRGDRQVGRSRVTLSATATSLRFSPIAFSGGTILSQRERDRRILSAGAQGELAFSPGAVVFGQIQASDTVYRWNTFLGGAPNLDSTSWRALGGINLDLPGYIRGTAGLGYSRRSYAADTYRTVAGLSAEVELTYFYSELTNFRVSGRRVIEDAAIAGNLAFTDTAIALGADQELKRNVIVSATASYGRQTYFDSPLAFTSYQLSGTVQYLMVRNVRARVEASFARRNRDDQGGGLAVNAASVGLGLTLQL